MKILHILGNGRIHRDPSSAALSGAVRATLEYAKHQASFGHDVQVVGFGEQNLSFTWCGVKMVSLKEFHWAKFRLGKRELDFSRHFPFVIHAFSTRFDVVHSHMHPYLRWIRGRIKIAHIHVAPSSDIDGHLLPQTRLGLAQLDKHAHAVIAVSQFVREQLLLDIKKQKIQIIYNGGGFTNDQWNESLSRRNNNREKLNISSTDVLIMYAGAFVPDKGIHHLAQSFTAVAEKYTNAHIALVGGGLWGNTQIPNSSDRRYTEKVHAILAPIATKTHFLGLVPSGQMIDIYAAADILVVPSVCREAFGITALEGLSGALPVIASNSGGLAELIGEQRGLLIPPGDEHALTEALERLISNPEERKVLGERGQSYARQPQFTWEEAARQTIALYERYLGDQQ